MSTRRAPTASKPAKRRKTSRTTRKAKDDELPPWQPRYHVVRNSKDKTLRRVNFKSPFDPDLDLEDICIEGEPDGPLWQDIKQYKAFQPTHCQEKIRVGTIIAVRGEESVAPDTRGKNAATDNDFGDYSWWYAQLLEVRAKTSSDVYLRVAWLYRPEDLPGGRQDYHGHAECIPSNDMQIIQAESVQGPATLLPWDELVSPECWNDDAVLVWRQTLNVWGDKSACYKKQVLSKLERVCICEKYIDPDLAYLHCPHCDRLMHEKCIANAAIMAFHKEQSQNKEQSQDMPKSDLEPPCLQEEEVKTARPLLAESTTAQPFKTSSLGRIFQTFNSFGFLNGQHSAFPGSSPLAERRRRSVEAIPEPNKTALAEADEADGVDSVDGLSAPINQQSSEATKTTPSNGLASITSQKKGRIKGKARKGKGKAGQKSSGPDAGLSFTEQYSAQILALYEPEEKKRIVISTRSEGDDDDGGGRFLSVQKLVCLFPNCMKPIV